MTLLQNFGDIAKYTSVTSNYTVSAADQVIWVDASAGTVILTLPLATARPGKIYTVIRKDTTTNIIRVNGAYDYCYVDLKQQFASDGSYWWPTMDGSATRVVAFESSASSSPTGTISAAYNVVKYVVAKDTYGAYNAATGIYTIPVTGFYPISANVRINGSFDSTTNLLLAIFKNGLMHKHQQFPKQLTAGTAIFMAISSDLYLNANETIAIYTYCSGSIGSTSFGPSDNHDLSISRTAGPPSANPEYYLKQKI